VCTRLDCYLIVPFFNFGKKSLDVLHLWGLNYYNSCSAGAFLTQFSLNIIEKFEAVVRDSCMAHKITHHFYELQSKFVEKELINLWKVVLHYISNSPYTRHASIFPIQTIFNTVSCTNNKLGLPDRSDQR
jgi:hypothetical protein